MGGGQVQSKRQVTDGRVQIDGGDTYEIWNEKLN
jgi:hypothetical protein